MEEKAKKERAAFRLNSETIKMLDEITVEKFGNIERQRTACLEMIIRDYYKNVFKKV